MEEWKLVVGSENHYVSDLGNFKRNKYQSIDKNGHKRTFNNKNIKGYVSNNGYISININGKRDLAHRIVAKTFLPNPYKYNQVNHINGIKTDNRVLNLEWCTSAQNLEHASKRLDNNMVYRRLPEANIKLRALFRLKNINKTDLSKHMGYSNVAGLYYLIKKDLFAKQRVIANYLGVDIKDIIDDDNIEYLEYENNTLGGKVWSSRMVLGLTRKELSKKIGCSDEYIRIVEANKQVPSDKFSASFSTVLNIDIKEFNENNLIKKTNKDDLINDLKQRIKDLEVVNYNSKKEINQQR